MRKTVFLIRNISPEKYGGAESYQIELAKILKKNNYEPIIFSQSSRLIKNAKEEHIKTVIPPYQKRQNWSSWRIILLPKYFLWQIKASFWYKKQIQRIKPEAVFIQSRDEWIATTLAAKKIGTKVFWIDHIDFRTWVLQNVNIPFKNAIGKKILSLAKSVDKIIMISDYERTEFSKITKKWKIDNVITIKNGVIDQINKYKSIKPTIKSFCYVGRLVDYKGLNELIDAFIRIKDQDVTLNIYGDGENKDKYQKKAAGDTRIIFHGYTDDPLKAIAKSEFFVLPSYYEGLSIALLQAAMLGKTVIATNIDGNPEVVDKKTGILIPSKNTDKLYDAMTTVLNNKQLCKITSSNIRKKYEQEFDFEKTVKERIIGELL